MNDRLNRLILNLPVRYDSVYIINAGLFLPGPPIDNESIDQYIAPLNRSSERIKRQVLRDNGIKTRHYAISETGETLYSSCDLAAQAVRDCLDGGDVDLHEITLLCTGSSGGDTGMPGFANMLQGELGAPPMETSSHQGVCAAGVIAMKHAANAIELKAHKNALVVTSEFPSRLFKKSRFAPRNYDTDFDSHFLRWMLSDGAGACLLSDTPKAGAISLKLNWVHTRSFSGDFPVCMQVGYPEKQRPKSYLDYPSFADAEQDGAFTLRQDIRLLPNLFDVGIHEYAELVRAGMFDPNAIDHFLCHYSSEKFSGVIESLMTNAGLVIPRERWYSNLATRGNTGAASIFIMLADFLREKKPRAGDKVLCFIPESGRFTVSFMLLEVVEADAEKDLPDVVPPPHQAQPGQDPLLVATLRDLASVWHEYRSRAWRTPMVRKILAGEFTIDDYIKWMECWIPQVREGSKWMRTAISHIDEPYIELRDVIEAHATDEQFDFNILFDDYKLAGGKIPDIDLLRRNPGGEALNSYMFSSAQRPNPVGLLGGIYIIEGTGQRIIPALLPMIRKQVRLPEQAFRFLKYHGANDINHLARWLRAVEYVLMQDQSGNAGAAIVDTARATGQLYVMQMEHIL
ncbi:MAG TPA: 3-oxoacyl-[acyl-carrier-protein] synthase III C-terminal domain-containing protein [Burkholderiales bacterium]|nr:3-oxoacyl-[acyl-carrier-protein] synthase III C-terminal domain-containing protein [Burkholderiales bacterium]